VKVPDLTGLEGVKRAAFLEINTNSALTSLHGLENLTTVSDSLEIQQNPRLTSVDALESLREMAFFQAVANPLLPTCELDALVARTKCRNSYLNANDDEAICR
jgi:hypothetical protein